MLGPTVSNGAKTIMLAGGGSGGHLMPGLAIAERLIERDPSVRCMFLCSDRPLDVAILSQAGVVHRVLPAQPLARTPFPGAVVRFIRGWRSARRVTAQLIEAERALGRNVSVVSLGGFVAAPAIRQASRMGLKTFMVNLDAVPGKANRLIAGRVDVLVSAVPVRSGGRRFADARVVGMPIRRNAVSKESVHACRARFGLALNVPVLLVLGASQGAGTFNRLMLSLLDDADAISTLRTWQVLHITGPVTGTGEGRAILEAAYKQAGVHAAVMEFCEEMGRAWRAADLALSRAGASSVAEAEANAIPTLFAPYPWHKDEHQRFNALPLINTGKAWLARDEIHPTANLAGMGRRLVVLMADSAAREDARRRLLGASSPDAASVVAEILLGDLPERPTKRK